ncbi:MAG: hypothetical protein JXO22_14820 [Phycisphaerae bacterium]|nr:hypothetical protein [Phycisphaerae bacterium]
MFDARAFLEQLITGNAVDSPSPDSFDGRSQSVTLRATPDELPADWRVWFEERAAIREYDGMQAREHAEAEALAETVAAMRAAGDWPLSRSVTRGD